MKSKDQLEEGNKEPGYINPEEPYIDEINDLDDELKTAELNN